MMVWNNDLPNGPLLYKVNLASSSLSLVASSIMTYHCFNTKNKTIALKLILAIALSDFLYSVANILTAFETEENNIVCHIDAFLRQFSVVSSIFWVTCTAVICYKTSTSWRLFNQNRFLKRAIIIGVCLCLLPTLIPLLVKRIVYANGSLYCLISYSSEVTDRTEKLLIFILLEGLPICLGFIITLVGYALAIRNVKRTSREFVTQMEVNMYRLLWYPALIFVTFVPCFLDYLFQLYFGTSPTFVQVGHLLLTHSLGLNNAILYGFQRRVYNSKSKQDTATIVTATNNHHYTDSITRDLMQAGFEDF